MSLVFFHFHIYFSLVDKKKGRYLGNIVDLFYFCKEKIINVTRKYC